MRLLQYLLLKILYSRPTKALQLLGQEKIGFLSISKAVLADGFVFPEEGRATLYSSSSYAVGIAHHPLRNTAMLLVV